MALFGKDVPIPQRIHIYTETRQYIHTHVFETKTKTIDYKEFIKNTFNFTID